MRDKKMTFKKKSFGIVKKSVNYYGFDKRLIVMWSAHKEIKVGNIITLEDFFSDDDGDNKLKRIYSENIRYESNDRFIYSSPEYRFNIGDMETYIAIDEKLLLVRKATIDDTPIYHDYTLTMSQQNCTKTATFDSTRKTTQVVNFPELTIDTSHKFELGLFTEFFKFSDKELKEIAKLWRATHFSIKKQTENSISLTLWSGNAPVYNNITKKSTLNTRLKKDYEMYLEQQANERKKQEYTQALNCNTIEQVESLYSITIDGLNVFATSKHDSDVILFWELSQHTSNLVTFKGYYNV